MYAYVENGEVKRVGNLPKTWQLKDGGTVSGFHLLANSEDDKHVLKEEGWLPLEENKPEYNAETHFLANPQYEVLDDKVVRNYTVEEIPEIEQNPSEVEILSDYVLGMDYRLVLMEMGVN